jgi:hypothetical protein
MEGHTLSKSVVRIAVVAMCATVCGLASAWDLLSHGSEPVADPRLDAVVPLFQEFAASLDLFGVVGEAEVPGGFRLVVVHALTPSEKVDRSLRGDDFFKQEAYGVFLFHEDGQLEMAVDIFRSVRWGDGIVDIVAAAENTCTVTYRGATYGFDFGTRKYFYDLPGRRVLNRVVYYGFDVTDMVQVGTSVYFLAQDGRARRDRPTMLLRLDSVGSLADRTTYSITESIQGEPIPPISRVVVDGATLLLQTKKRQYALSNGTWSVGANAQDWQLTRVDGEYVGIPGGSLGGGRATVSIRGRSTLLTGSTLLRPASTTCHTRLLSSTRFPDRMSRPFASIGRVWRSGSAAEVSRRDTSRRGSARSNTSTDAYGSGPPFTAGKGPTVWEQ